MNTHLIAAAGHATLHAEKPFPQIVGMRIEAGVEFYHVDRQPAKSQLWHDFTIRAMNARHAMQGYFAFQRGQRVTYFGRQGDQHTE